MGKGLFERRLKKATACIAAAAVVCSMCAAVFPAAYGAVGVVGVVQAAEENVTEIGTAEALKTFAAEVNDGKSSDANVRLTADIDLTNVTGWTPIGTSTNPYTGTFDGNGYTISGWTATADATTYGSGNPFGLFGVTTGATIENLTISGAAITGESGSYVGVLCGLATETTITGCTVDETCTVNCTTTTAGGMVCMMTGGTISECTVSAVFEIGTAGPPAGGFVAIGDYNNGSITILNSIFNGTIKTNALTYIGGFAGVLDGNILNCIYAGTIQADTIELGSTFCAYRNGGNIINCYSNGKVTGTAASGATYGVFGGDGNSTAITNCIAGPLLSGIDPAYSSTNVTDCASLTSADIASGQAEYLLNNYASTLASTEQDTYRTSEWKPYILDSDGDLEFGTTARNIRRVKFYTSSDVSDDTNYLGAAYILAGETLTVPDDVTAALGDTTVTTWRSVDGTNYTADSVVESDQTLYPYVEKTYDADILDIKKVSATLSDDISFTLLLHPDVLEAYNNVTVYVYDDTGALFYAAGASADCQTTVDGTTYPYVKVRGITAKEMSREYQMVVTGTNDGGETETKGEVVSYSVASYIKELITADSAGNNLKKICINLVNYGAAAQTYFGYKTDSLANEGFDDYQSYATASSVNLSDLTGSSSTCTNTGDVKITGRTLVLRDTIGFAVILDTSSYAGEIDDISVKVTDTDGSFSETVSGKNLKAYGSEEGKYYALIGYNDDAYKISPQNVAMSYTFTVYAGETVSATMTYGISAYAYNKRNSTSTNLVALLKQLEAYGNAAIAYANNPNS